MQDIVIEELGLSVRTSNCLRKSDIFFLSQIMMLTEEDMKQIRNMGAKSINEVLDLQVAMKAKFGDTIEEIKSIADVGDAGLEDSLLINKSFH